MSEDQRLKELIRLRKMVEDNLAHVTWMEEEALRCRALWEAERSKLNALVIQYVNEYYDGVLTGLEKR